MSTILIVDDEANLRRLLGMVLREDGHRVLEADSLDEARKRLGERDVELVITDQKLGDGDGLAVLAATRELVPGAPVLFLTAYATVELAVSAMRAGAFDVISKPFDPDAVKASVRRAAAHAGLVRENQLLREQVGRMDPAGELVGDAPPMRQLNALVAKVAPTGATVLIHGETGTGKELVARAIHHHSQRREKKMVTVNCTAIPQEVLESELFGHVKGSFTGAVASQEGLFQRARGGTILSTEDQFAHLARQLRPRRLLLAGIETGVWYDFPACTQLVSEVNPENIARILPSLGGSEAVDVTGGMASKVQQMLELAKGIQGLEVLIFSGKLPGTVQRVLGGAQDGTLIAGAG